MTTTAPDTGRLSWVDNAKAIAIWLIVLGHAQSMIPRGVVEFVYAFHVPVFVLISGLLLSAVPLKHGLGSALGRQVMPMVRYYLFFSALAVVLFLARRLATGAPLELPQVIWGSLYGSVGPDLLGYSEGIFHENRPLWYLPFLVTSMTLFLLALRLPKPAMVALVVVLALACAQFARPEGARWPWGLDVVGVGAFFLMLGWLMKGHIDRLARAGLSPLLLIGAAVLAFAAMWALTMWNGRVNINGRMFGQLPPLALLAACLGCAGLIALCMALPCPRLFRRLSQHTLVIFTTHKYFLEVFQLLATRLLPKSLLFPAAIVISLAVTWICLMLSERISGWLARHVGRKPARPQAA